MPSTNEPSNLKFIKREAVRLKRNKPGLRHHQALDQAAIDRGYTNFAPAREKILRLAKDEEPDRGER